MSTSSTAVDAYYNRYETKDSSAMTLTIYTKPRGCFGCTKTKDLFTAAGVAFTEVDITTNEQALEYISEELGYAQVPVVVYEKDGSEDHWSGLNPTKIHQVIALDSHQ